MGSHLGDAVEWILCRTVGCASPFSKVAEWPYTKVCNPFVMWRTGIDADDINFGSRRKND